MMCFLCRFPFFFDNMDMYCIIMNLKGFKNGTLSTLITKSQLYYIHLNYIFIGYFTPVTYLPLMAQQLGSSGQEAAFLISILGIVTSIGRISVGYIADKPWANVVLLNSIALIVIGGATIIVPFLKHYALLATYCGVFGLCMGKL